MRLYKDKPSTKTKVDLMQIQFGCCGNEGYNDWFNFQWYSDDYINKRALKTNKDGLVLVQDVPFSCCNPDVKIPCVHHAVDTDTEHVSYDHKKELTIYSKGGREMVMEAYAQFLHIRVGGPVGLMLIAQFFLIFIIRCVHTSIANAMLEVVPTVSAKGYLLS